ncbi:unnamed protein product, partial [Brenthis ino]
MKKNQDSNNQRQSYPVSQRDWSESGSSKGWNNRKQEEPVESNDLEESIDDADLSLEDGSETESELEQVNLKLKYLELKAEQIKCKQQLLSLKKAGKKPVQKPLSNMCILPDGRIVVKNDNERLSDNAFGSAAGDSITMTCSCDRAWIEPTTSSTATPTGNKDKVRYTERYSVSTVTKSIDRQTEVTKSVVDITKISETKRSDDSDSNDELDETNRLIQLRNVDYLDIVEERLKVVIALSGYPKTKMRLKQMELFQKCLNDIIDMQAKSGLLKKTPSFLDYYLNRGAIVCICKDVDSRDWMVRVYPGLQERMCCDLILLKAKVKRLCLAMIKIPKSCWPATVQDAFKLLQYFNPTLKTHLWKVYAQKSIDDVECTSFIIDRVSGEIIRGPNFKNVIDYKLMEFEINGYTEIYYDCYLSDMTEDLSSVASRVKLLDELKSNENTQRNKSDNESVDTVETYKHIKDVDYDVPDKSEETFQIEEVNNENTVEKVLDVTVTKSGDMENVQDNVNNDVSINIELDKLETDEVEINETGTSGIAYSEQSEIIAESNDIIVGRNSNLNIDSSRGMAYHRRTNYLHVENELKIAVVLEGYPQEKLEGSHIRRFRHLFKDTLHKDMKVQRFPNLIIPKFQDVYLSNGAVIYICDSLETKDYLTELLPKFINSTGLKLTFRNVNDLVRYTRVVMRVPKEIAHLQSHDILIYFQDRYPNIKLDCWKFYSDVAGKQKRQFGVDPESLQALKSDDFDATYAGEKIDFRIIDRKKNVSGNETFTNNVDDDIEFKQIKEKLLKCMYSPIDPDIMNVPLTRIRANHYSDLVDDDLKLYVGPINYPETRIDEIQFNSIKEYLESIVFETFSDDLDSIPIIHDMYLFDGVIFIICRNMKSRVWIEKNIDSVNFNLKIQLKATEFRGAVGIVTMIAKTNKTTEEVINILQNQNPRLRTKFWRKISKVQTRSKLDVVLQIDKLSAQVITDKRFDSIVDGHIVEFKLGHLQSLLKPKLNLDDLNSPAKNKNVAKNIDSKSVLTEKVVFNNKIEKEKNKPNTVYDKENDENCSKVHELKLNSGESKTFLYTIENKSDKSSLKSLVSSDNIDDCCKVVMKVPTNILPDFNDGLEIILDLLEDKNPGLNTELWKSLPALQRHICLTCGSPADSYCGRCGVAPYCSQKCQQQDWQKRHRAVCHNLSRGSGKNGPELVRAKDPKPVEQSPPVPLRQPAPICNQNQKVKRDDKREDNMNNSDRPKRDFHPPSQKVNRNPNFKSYNNLRRPKVANENQSVQDEEESFETPETNPQKPVQPQSKPVKQEPTPPRPVMTPPRPVMTPPVNFEANVPSVSDTKPVKNIVPKNYMVETLQVGDTVLLSVEAAAASCRAGAGLVCLALHTTNAAIYNELCSDYDVSCKEDGYTYAPRPGELFSYYDPADEAWYRARRVSPTLAALIDACRVITLSSSGSEGLGVGRCARISNKYAEIPEFCCVLEAPDVKIGDNLQCTIISKTGDKCKVSVVKGEGGPVTEGEISRWRPRVDGLDSPVIPEVERPPIKNNMKVYLVDCTSLDRVILRPSDIDSCKEFDAIQEDVLLYAKDASPLREPPQKGDIVIAKFTDGLWYRALCKRTNNAQNKYQLEYLEYGNIEISTRENLYPCPEALRPHARPTTVLRACFADAPAASASTSAPALAPPAAQYVRTLSDGQVELVVTLLDGSSSAPSGAEVNLQVVRTNESVNKKIVALSTPEWKKLEEKGGDVIETPRLMLNDISYMELPRNECDLDVFIDLTMLQSGVVNGRPRQPDLETKLEELTKRMEEYCNSNLGKDPYLPKPEELCIALCPPYPQWFRAMLCEQVGGAGGPLLRLLYLDYGNLETVTFGSVRKMLPEFMKPLPALALNVDIRGFPKHASTELLLKACAFMKCDEEGRGRLRVRNCQRIGLGMYEADAPELLAALGI